MRTTAKELYFTGDHEWIDFQGPVAFTGICHFKLLGFKEIQEISFREPSVYKPKGDIIATIRYNDYVIEAHMPVDGKIIGINEELQLGDPAVLLHYPETSGWIAKIAPSRPYDRAGLLLAKEYQLNGKDKFAK